MRFATIVFAAAISLSALIFAQAANGQERFDQGRTVTGERSVLEFRDRVAPENEMTRDRLEHLLPELMEETGLDMWLVINREYAESSTRMATHSSA